MKNIDVKKYTKITMALISAGVVSAGLSYWGSSVKLNDNRKIEIYNSVYTGKFLGERVGKDVLMLGQNYLGKENLNEAQFNRMMENKKEFDDWIAQLELEPDFKKEVDALKEAWKDLSDQLDFVRNFYNSSVKTLSNPTEAMMVTKKNRAFFISESSDKLPNDVPYGAENTIENQRIEYNSPLKQNLRSQIDKAVSSYMTNSDVISKSLNKIIEKSESGKEALKAEAMKNYLYITLTGFILISLSILVFGSFGGRIKEKNESEQELSLILNNIKEGMFIMSPTWEVVGNVSSSLSDLLNKEISVGDNFYTFLQSKVDAKTAVLSKDYLKLLIEKNLTEKLVSNVNPLKLINVGSENVPNVVAITLSPIKGGAEVNKVLVTVKDANEQKKLEDNVKTEKLKSSNQFDFLLKMMQAQEQTLFIQFFQKLQEVICEQNEKLKTASSDEQSLRELLVLMQGETHTLKSQAGILGLDLYQQMLHDFEDTIFAIKKKDPLKAEDMHTLSFFHKEVLEKTGGLIAALEVAMQNRMKGQPAEAAALSMGASLLNSGLPELSETQQQNSSASDDIPFHQGLENLDTGGLSLLDDTMKTDLGLNDMNGLGSFNTTIKHSDSLFGDLTVLVKNASDKLDKKVNISLNLTSYDLVDDEKRDTLRSILMHLVNNSVVHGIETTAEREKKNKYPVGIIQIFDEIKTENFQDVATIHVVDDGAGLNIEKIRARAIELAMDIGDGSPSKLIPLIFTPDFTTNDTEDFFSGRGIGLSFVKSEVERLGGSISMKMRPGNYIEFTFQFKLSEM